MAEGRWLDAKERQQWLTYIFATNLLYEQFERDLQRDAGMPLAYYQILVALSDSPDRTQRMSDLAGMLLVSRSRLSHAVARLEDAAWVRRSRCANDRRGSYATLTDAGFAVLEAAAPHHVNSVRAHLFDQLTPEQLEQLREINKKLLDHLLPSLGWEPPSLLAFDHASTEAAEAH
jgi:DNA-binding MarR family transcriptional regulator